MQNIKSQPKEWEEETLGKVADVFSGSTPSTKESTYWDGQIPWITPKDLSDYKSVFISRGERNITEDGLKNSSIQKLPKNTILFSSRAPIGYVAIAQNGITTNQGFKNIVCDEERSHYKFFYYWLRLNARNIEKQSSGSTFSEATAGVMRALKIKLPPLSEQKAIAAVLSSLDNKIELLQEQNKTLEATAQAIFREWFIKPTLGKKLPKGWELGKLANEFEIVMGQSPEGESYNESGEGMVFFQGRTDFGFRFPTTRLFTTNPKRIAEKFDVLVSVRAPVGDINMALDTCCIGRGVAAVKNKFKSYSYYKIKTLKRKFEDFESTGTVFGSMNKDDFNNIEVAIPDNDLIKKFEQFANPIDAKIYNNSIAIQTLSQLRDSLLPKLLRGDLRVKNIPSKT